MNVLQRVVRKASKKLVVYSTFLLHEVSFAVNKLLKESPLLFIGWWVFQCVLSPTTRDTQIDCILAWLFLLCELQRYNAVLKTG